MKQVILGSRMLGSILFATLISGCGNTDRPIAERIEPSAQPLETKTAFSREDSARFDNFFRDLTEKKQFSGNVLFYDGGKKFAKSYGLANRKTGDSLTLDHKFQLASVSKPFTAAATLLLAGRGLLNIEDSVQVYLPDFPYSGITVKMLLTHRSGLGNYMYVTDDMWENKDLPLCNDNLIDSLCRLCPDAYYPPDVKFNYCNTNYFLLSVILEKVTGMNFESLMQKYLFAPLKMNNTFIYSNMNYLGIEKVAAGHSAFGRIKPDFYLNGITGDKGMFSTVEDLLKFDRALDTLLIPEHLEAMYTPASPFDRRGKSYGYGWRIKKLDRGEVIYHKGWWRGYRSYFLRIPEREKTAIILSNSTAGDFFSVEELTALLEPQ